MFENVAGQIIKFLLAVPMSIRSYVIIPGPIPGLESEY
jgi:hypothetical protein